MAMYKRQQITHCYCKW